MEAKNPRGGIDNVWTRVNKVYVTLEASRRVWQIQVAVLRRVMAYKDRPGAVEVVTRPASVVQGARSHLDMTVGSHLDGEAGDRKGMGV